MGITMNVIYNKHIQKILEGLEKETISKVTRAIDLLEIYGEDLKMPNSKRIGHGLLELRIHGKQEIRIFYTLINEEAYLLHLYIKKTQKIPAKEMKTARERLIALNNYH
jgi:phage-related protein